MADLQELFMKLKSNDSASNRTPSTQNEPSIWAQPPSQDHQQPSVSSPLFSPPIHTPNPIHSSAILSPVNMTSSANTPAPDPTQNHLLNLLRFKNNQGSQPTALASLQNVGAERSPSLSAVPSKASESLNQARSVSASDLVASFKTKPSTNAALPAGIIAPPSRKPEVKLEAPSGSSSDFLLALLKQAKQTQQKEESSPLSEQPKVSEPAVDSLAHDLANTSITPVGGNPAVSPSRSELEATPVRLFGGVAAGGTTPFEAPKPAGKTQFDVVNPFEQLAKTAPRNRTPLPEANAATPNMGPSKIEVLKHARDASGSINGDAAAPSAKLRKLTSQPSSSAPSPLPDGRSPLEALMGIGAGQKSQSVQEALGGVGEKVDQQVKEALAQADAQTEGSQPAKVPVAAAQEKPWGFKDIDEHGAQAPNHPVMNETAEQVEQDVASSWESADAEESPAKEDTYDVKVYEFPMKPFVSITVNRLDAVTAFRSDSILDIARLKKDFDQADRALVTASSAHIAYALPKRGGFRLIRQDSGKDKEVFSKSKERICHVQLCVAPTAANDMEALIGTGVDGSVFWTSLTKSRGETFDEDEFETLGFIFPPLPLGDDNTSGSPVKTRAKKSTRHPEFFAIARGKNIHIISPLIARQPAYSDKKTRITDTEKYMQERSLKIATGKAGKDFCFSEDDAVLVSLDKNGRLKFWDIREMTDLARDGKPGKRSPIELKTPLLTLMAMMPAEKATPSSVMLVDKDRPHAKGVALRYLIVGLKQNHTLQLWDLGLGKPVQELHLPHEKDSDAICSISYHAKSGIIVLGHPTRNSIYFIHLSAPKYHVPTMDQAKYVGMLAAKDPSLPKPDATAIMSGIREFSFNTKGQIRSVEILDTPITSDPEEPVVFELYVMHSKGVAALSIKRAELGWSENGTVLNPVDGIKSKAISIEPLRVTSATPVPGENASLGDAVSRTTTTTQDTSNRSSQKSTGEATVRATSLARVENKQDSAPAVAVNGADKAAKKKNKKQAAGEENVVLPEPVNPALITPASYAMAAQRAKTPPIGLDTSMSSTPKIADAVASSAPTANVDVESLSRGVSAEISTTLNREIDSLYRRIDEDKRVQDAAGAAKFDAVLKLVSSTLGENVERSLSRIITGSIQSTVLPALSDVTTSTLDRKLTEVLAQELKASVPKEIKAALSAAVTRALQDQQVHNNISELVGTKLTAHVERQFATVLQTQIVPNFTNMTVNAMQKLVANSEQKTAEQLRQAEVQHKHDSAKIDRLQEVVLSLSETVKEMAAGQVAFQEQMLNLQRHAAESARKESRPASPVGSEPVQLSLEDEELQSITKSLTEGKYEEGTINWLQSPNQGGLFDKLFVRCNPQYLLKLSPLVTLSVAAAVTASFDDHVDERLDWLAIILSTMDLKDQDIYDVAPKVMDVLSQRLSGVYMTIGEQSPGSPTLRKIVALSKQVSDIKTVTG
ncbi:hypothetical protein LTR66_001649 [Elasticomyces elasticus]|nr:hypothetical protein LTR66_001649 [Elasticomyces elasticus]